MKLKIQIPQVNQPEVRYVLHCLFDQFLGLEYDVFVDESVTDFKIIVGDKTINIKNHFFITDKVEELYTLSNIPLAINKAELRINNIEYPIVSLFGSATYSITKTEYTLDADIISATFFMLTRWEEYANKERDAHNRFAAVSSVAFKNGFLERPIVNEYVEILWAILLQCGYTGEKKKWKYTIVPTHDVDRPYLWTTKLDGIKSIASAVLKQRNFFDAKLMLKSFIDGVDPYDTYDLFMDLSEKENIKSYFFFMAGGTSSYDNRYSLNDDIIITLIKKVIERGHVIGLHPSYNSFDNRDMIAEEKEKLSKVSSENIECGRHHYLRFSIPYTWQIWEDIGMEWDSTLSYADSSGFRAGICFPFPVYNILSRKMLHLIERPLIVMEGTVIGYENLTLEECILKCRKLKNEVKKYNGEFIFLWHNSSFNTSRWAPFESLLIELYKK